MRTATASLAIVGLMAAALCGHATVTGDPLPDRVVLDAMLGGDASVAEALSAMCWPGPDRDHANAFGWCEFLLLGAMLAP